MYRTVSGHASAAEWGRNQTARNDVITVSDHTSDLSPVYDSVPPSSSIWWMPLHCLGHQSSSSMYGPNLGPKQADLFQKQIGLFSFIPKIFKISLIKWNKKGRLLI